MAALQQCACVVLVLVGVLHGSWAQGAPGAPPAPAAAPPAVAAVPPPPPPPAVTVKPPEPAPAPAAPAPVVNQAAPVAPPPAVNKTVPVPPAPVVEVPVIAAKQVDGAPGLNKTVLVAVPDAIKKVLGSKCSVDSDCLSINNNTKCTDNMCGCKPGFVPSKHSLDKCLKVPSGLGDSCEENAQCSRAVPSSECQDSKCACPPGYVFGGSSCWPRQMLGGSCNVSEQCEDVMFASCAQGVCTCESPLIPSPVNKCLQPAGDVYLAPCVEDIQCTYSFGDQGRCSDGQCKCHDSFHFDGAKCIADIQLGAACLLDLHCAVSVSDAEEPPRVCQDNVCACAPGYAVLPGEDICSKSSGEELAVSLTWVMCIVLAKYYLS